MKVAAEEKTISVIYDKYGNKSRQDVLKLKGLPFQTSEDEVSKWLSNAGVKVKRVHLCKSAPRTSEGKELFAGEAFVEIKEKHMETALRQNRKYLGDRFIKVTSCSQRFMEVILNALKVQHYSVRMRGLPYECEKYELVEFFHGLKIAEDGIVMHFDDKGMPNGEAMVQFKKQFYARKALKRNGKKIRKRSVNIYPCKVKDFLEFELSNQKIFAASAEVQARVKGWMAVQGTDRHPKAPKRKGQVALKMKGLSESTTSQDIRSWFQEADCSVKKIQFCYNNEKQIDTAFVVMKNKHHVEEAAKKNRTRLNGRLVEIFSISRDEMEVSVDLYKHRTCHVVLFGLPFSCTVDEIMKLFEGLDVAEDGVYLCTKGSNVRSGMGFVRFTTQKAAKDALKKDHQYIGERYVGVKKCGLPLINKLIKFKLKDAKKQEENDVSKDHLTESRSKKSHKENFRENDQDSEEDIGEKV